MEYKYKWYIPDAYLHSRGTGYFTSHEGCAFINETGRALRTFLTAVFYMPVLAGNIYFVWAFLLSSDSYGVINGLLLQMNIIQEPIGWLVDQNWMMGSLIVVQLWMSLGTGFLAFIAGFQSMDKSLFEAGAIDGVRNRWQELWYITIPSMKPQMLFGAVMAIVNTITSGQIGVDLTGANPTPGYSGSTMVTHIDDYGFLQYEMGYANAIAVVLLILVFVLSRVVNKFFSEREEI